MKNKVFPEKMRESVMKLIALIIMTCIISQTGCAAKQTAGSVLNQKSETVNSSDPVTKQSFYLDTICSVTVYDMDSMSKENADAVIKGTFDVCKKYEKILSKTIEGSDIWNINHAQGKPVECDPETIKVIQLGLEYSELSGGVFDITIGKAMDLWNFHEDENHEIPDPDDLKEAVSHVDYHQVHVDGNTVTMEDPEGEIDLGGIGKGYIADRACEYLKSQGVTSALISLGGNIAAVGEKHSNGTQTPFTIGIETPYSDMTKIIGSCEVNDETLVTSGVYERYFEKDGKEYHHILDVKTGYPADSDILGVTIRSASGRSANCDALSTTCLVLGTEKAKAFIEGLDGYEALFIDRDNNITMTSGMEFSKL